jgi:hypothetical protein
VFTKIGLSLAIVLGAASAALANDPTGQDGGGYRVQTWQDIQHAPYIQDQIRSQYHAADDNGRNAYGFVVSPNRKHGSGIAASPTPTRRLSREND